MTQHQSICFLFDYPGKAIRRLIILIHANLFNSNQKRAGLVFTRNVRSLFRDTTPEHLILYLQTISIKAPFDNITVDEQVLCRHTIYQLLSKPIRHEYSPPIHLANLPRFALRLRDRQLHLRGTRGGVNHSQRNSY